MSSQPTVDPRAYRRFLIGLLILAGSLPLGCVTLIAWVVGTVWRVELAASLFLASMGLLQCLIALEIERKERGHG